MYCRRANISQDKMFVTYKGSNTIKGIYLQMHRVTDYGRLFYGLWMTSSENVCNKDTTGPIKYLNSKFELSLKLCFKSKWVWMSRGNEVAWQYLAWISEKGGGGNAMVTRGLCDTY